MNAWMNECMDGWMYEYTITKQPYNHAIIQSYNHTIMYSFI